MQALGVERPVVAEMLVVMKLGRRIAMNRKDLLIFAVVFGILLVCAFLSDVSDERENYLSPAMLRQEIYQVRGQFCVTSTIHTRDGPKTVNQVAVMLRNGRGEDFQVKIPESLPENTFFVKPTSDEKGKRILVSVPTIVQEQEEHQ
jgi:hypothetical protein